jgi:hypothetical protein
MTFLEAQRAARRGGHRLVNAGHTPNRLYRILVCELLVSQGFGAEALREAEFLSTVCAAVERVMETLGWPAPTSPTPPTG